MSKDKWKLVTEMPVLKYKCGLKAGDFVRLKKDIVVRDHKGQPTGKIHQAHEIWKVVNGSKEKPIVVWLLQSDGKRHTWHDDSSIFDWFELVEEEIFDIVNERDEVIGQAPRKEVHARGLWHRAVHVLVFNARGEVFLQKRSMRKDIAAGKWDSSASGHLDTGEDYDTCAVREVREEIGLNTQAGTATGASQPLRRLFKIDARQETGWEFCWIYRCESEGPFVLHPDEIETGAWFAPDAVTKWVNEKPEDFASAFVLIWKIYLATDFHR